MWLSLVECIVMIRKTLGLLLIAMLIVGFTASPVAAADNETTTDAPINETVTEEETELAEEDEATPEDEEEAELAEENETEVSEEDGELGRPNEKAVENNGWLSGMFDKIAVLSQNAGNMTGQEVSSIAQSLHDGMPGNSADAGNSDDKRPDVADNKQGGPDKASDASADKRPDVAADKRGGPSATDEQADDADDTEATDEVEEDETDDEDASSSGPSERGNSGR